MLMNKSQEYSKNFLENVLFHYAPASVSEIKMCNNFIVKREFSLEN